MSHLELAVPAWLCVPDVRDHLGLDVPLSLPQASEKTQVTFVSQVCVCQVTS